MSDAQPETKAKIPDPPNHLSLEGARKLKDRILEHWASRDSRVRVVVVRSFSLEHSGGVYGVRTNLRFGLPSNTDPYLFEHDELVE